MYNEYVIFLKSLRSCGSRFLLALKSFWVHTVYIVTNLGRQSYLLSRSNERGSVIPTGIGTLLYGEKWHVDTKFGIASVLVVSNDLPLSIRKIVF